MKQVFKDLVKKGVLFEMHMLNNDKNTFGLKWGESKKARTLGFKRNEVIKALDWAENNQKEAMKMLGF